MKTYTVEYRMTYDMTVEVQAPNEQEAIEMAREQQMEGEEHDCEASGFNVIWTEED